MKIITLLTFSACLLGACSRPTQTVQHEKLKINNNGVNIAYTDNGNGDTTLFFIHGWCINKGYWENQVRYFEKKYRVITIDLPGFGQSGKNRKEFNTRIYAQDINTVINKLNLKKVILIGHSMAGDIVLQASISNPVNVMGFVGIDNFKSVGIKPADAKQAKKDYEDAIVAMKRDFKAVAIPYFNQQLFYKTTSKGIRKRILNDVVHTDTTVAVKTQETDNFDETAKLKEYNKKLYLLNSDYDLTNVTGLKENHVPYNLTYIQGTGHFPMVEKPDEFNLLLAGVIKRM